MLKATRVSIFLALLAAGRPSSPKNLDQSITQLEGTLFFVKPNAFEKLAF